MMCRLIAFLLMICFSTAWANDAEFQTEKSGNAQIYALQFLKGDVSAGFTPFNELDFISTVHKVHVRGMVIELEDGSHWEVAEVSSETRQYYSPNDEPLPFDFVEDVVKGWQPGDRLIYQVVSDKEPLLVYNLDRGQLFDFTPFLPPLESSLWIAKIDFENQLVLLSDGSAWMFDAFSSEQVWDEGDPILVAINGIQESPAEYVLINLCACVCDSTVEHIHPNRLVVIRQ